MADDPVNVIHKITIEFNETIKKSGISKHLSRVDKQLNRTSKSFKKQSASLGRMSKMSFAAGKALGKVISPTLLLSKAAAGLVVLLVKTSDTFAKFAAVSGQGSAAVLTLRDSYWSMASSVESTTISVRDLSESMAKFAAQGFPQQLLASGESAQKSMAGLQETLTKGLGDPKAAEQLSLNLFKAASVEYPALVALQKSIAGAGGDAAKMLDIMKQTQFVRMDPQAFTEAQGAIQNVIDMATGGADPAVKSFLKWQEVSNHLTSSFSNMGQEIIKVIGPDIAKAVDWIREKVTKLTKHIPAISLELKLVWTVMKTVAHNFGEVFKSAWNMVSGLLKISVAGWTQILAKFISWLPGEWGAAAKDMNKWAAEIGKSGEKALESAFNPEFLHLEEELAKTARKVAGEVANQAKAGKKIVPIFDDASSAEEDLFKILKGKILPATEAWTKSLERSFGSLKTMETLVGLIGSKMTIAGKTAQGFTKELAARSVRSANALLSQASDKNIGIALRQIEALEAGLAKIRSEGGSQESIDNQQLAITGAEEDLNKLLTARATAYQKLSDGAKAYLSDLQADLDLAVQARKVQEARLAVTQAIYGTPALAVSAQLAVIETMQTEKKLLKDQLVKLNIYISTLAKGSEQYKMFQEKKLDLEEKITNKIRDQLQLAKQLRDGYIQAVAASAFGAGRFSKILITQEKNVMKGLEKRIVKQNYLMGAIGKAAAAADSQAMRFGAGGIGEITYVGGGKADIAKEAEARTKGMNARQKGPAEAITRIMTGAGTGGGGVMGGDIDRMATEQSRRAARATGLQGRAGITAAGEAKRTGRAPSSIAPKGVMGVGGGNLKSKMKIVTQILTQMATMVDGLDEGQNNITQYGDRAGVNQP